MASCLITDDALATCTDQLGVGGLQEEVYLINKADVLSITIDPITFAVSNIILKPTKRAYQFDAVRYTAMAGASYNNGDNKNWTHSITFNIAGFSQAQNNNFEKLATAKVLALVTMKVPNNAVGPIQQENRMQLLGRLNGLQATVDNTIAGPGAEVLSGYSVTMESFEIEMPKEVIPDPVLYPTVTPNAEFIDALLVP